MRLLKFVLLGSLCMNSLFAKAQKPLNVMTFNLRLNKNVLPTGLTYLEFGDMFNKPLTEEVLPEKLTRLEFGREFNQRLNKDVLPSGLTYLEFGNMFNQPLIKGVLPLSLNYLKFGTKFNQCLISQEILPKNLTYLTLYKKNMLNVE